MCPVGSEYFRADGGKDRQTDMKLIVAFCKSAAEPKMGEGNASIVRI
jgi:hypothetical protein